MEQHSHRITPSGPTWRQVFIVSIIALLLSSAWVIYELHRGVGLGEAIVSAGAKGSVPTDSIAKATALAREAIAHSDSTTHAVAAGVKTVVDEIHAISRDNRAFQRAQLRAIAKHVEHVEAKTDSIQMVLPRPKGRK